MKANKNTPDKKRKKPRVSILFKSIAGMVLLVIVFSILVSIMGFYSFTDALLEQYAEGALRTAETAAAALDDKLIAAWTGHPHLRIIDNSTEFEDKLKRLIAEISSFLGEPEPYEIERKFGIAPEEILVVDDLKPGYDMAKAAGVAFAAAGWANDIAQIETFMRKNCDVYFKTTRQLADFLNM